jgi:uncharacterized membrane protein YdjX (TVP38/TMEM64 family)
MEEWDTDARGSRWQRMRLSSTGKKIGVTLAVVACFIGVSVLAHAHEAALSKIVGAGGAWGIAGFIVLTAAFTVFLIPLDVSILIPISATVWGPNATALMSTAGWTLGSATAFFLARRFGAPFVEHIAGRVRLHAVEKTTRRMIPKQHLFWWALFMQALLPMDLISYAFGLFTEIGLGPYALATGIGDLVPGFFFAYAGTLPIWYEIGAMVVAFSIIGLLFWRSLATETLEAG